jgi:hypothetical protein
VVIPSELDASGGSFFSAVSLVSAVECIEIFCQAFEYQICPIFHIAFYLEQNEASSETGREGLGNPDGDQLRVGARPAGVPSLGGGLGHFF